MPQFNSMAGVTGLYRAILAGQEPLEVRVIGADVMRYEQIQKKSFFAGEGVSFTRIAFVVWAALKRTEQTDLSVQDFLKGLEDIEREGADDEDEDEDDDGDAEGALGDDGSMELPDPTEVDTTV